MTIKKPKNGSLYRFGDYKIVNMTYTVGYNWVQWHYTNLVNAKRKARELLGVKRLRSTQPFGCGPEGNRVGVLYYRTMQELRDDQDGSKGIQIEKW